MPETYIEPMTNRQECFQCHKTVTGKKKLSKCAGCHAITYCGVECQREDFPRHKWNCLPVMVTNIPGKGRGLVAARDIKMGEQIFTDKAHIQLFSSGQDIDEDAKSIVEQLNKLPSEARRQFHELPVLDSSEARRRYHKLPGVDSEIYQKFMHNAALRLAKNESETDRRYLSLNIFLMNHSCAPNVAAGPLQPHDDIKDEVRAIKDISRGDEVTMCYMNNRFNSGFNRQQRREKLKASFGFDCRCSVCSGDTADQEDILKKYKDLYNSTQDPHLLAVLEVNEELAELTDKIYIGNVVEIKRGALVDLAVFAHLGRDEARLGKAMDGLYKLGEDTKLEYLRCNYERFKRELSKWNAPFKSGIPASKDEIESFYKYWKF